MEEEKKSFAPYKAKCKNCGRMRTIVSEQWQTCQGCTEDIAAGKIPAPVIKKRGRPKLQEFIQDAPAPEPAPVPSAAPAAASQPESPSAAAEPAPDPAKPAENKNAESQPKQETNPKKYYCECCKKEIEYLEQPCKKCGYVNDWRNTPAKDAPDILVCPRCGAIVPAGAGRCPHCSYSGGKV